MAGEIINRLNVGQVVNVKLTDSAVTNGQNLVEAYNYAKTLMPNGEALSATNRVAVILQPGNYFFTTQLAIDTQFIDIIGLGSQKLERGAVPAVNFTTAQFGGVDPLNVTANDVRISGISVGSRAFIVANSLSLLVMENCVGGTGSFAGSISNSTGIASGTFVNCIGGANSFGSGGSGAGSASGTFINCTSGDASFGSGFNGTSSGIFINCTASGGVGNIGSFGSGFNATASGTFTNCIGAINSFGGGSANASGQFYQCRLTSGTFKTVIFSGLMRNCIDGNNNIVNQ
jgi:hypothetical protein